MESKKGNKKKSSKKIIKNKPKIKNEKIKSSKLSFDEIPDLPKVYGKNKMVFMIRDPYNGFVYWDMTESLRKKHDLSNKRINKYLRIYDITDNEVCDPSTMVIDVKINENAYSWYINFPRSNRVYIIELGYFKANKFVSILRSNSARLPRADVSDVVDDKWVLSKQQFELILQASGADILFEHDGSQELMKFLAGNLGESVSS